MAFVQINPGYRDLLQRHGLATAEQFLALPALLVSGHPDRHVGQVTLGTGPEAVQAFLKREHRIPARDRLASAWAGFGWVSKSCREAQVLQAAVQAGIGCPDWIAAGEDGRGRAFLLVRELTNTVGLDAYLREAPEPAERSGLALRLGQMLAHLHGAGFDHPDLYAKHVLIDRVDGSIHFIDWPRSRPGRGIGWEQRCRDLAALSATLSDELATPRERLLCLHAYLGAAGCAGGLRARRILRRLQSAQAKLLRRGHIRSLRRPPPAGPRQRLLWLDGEALCATPEFCLLWPGDMPDWLRFAANAQGRWLSARQFLVPLPGGRLAVFQSRRSWRPLACLWMALGGRRPSSPELEQASLLFRLQRHGVPVPRLLAFGQRTTRLGAVHSFVLTEAGAATPGASPSGPRSTSEHAAAPAPPLPSRI